MYRPAYPVAPPTATNRSPVARWVGGLAAAAAVLTTLGCASDGGSSRTSTAIAADPAMTAADVEQRYVIGPAAARELGYRVDWQYPSTGRGIKSFVVQHDSVFTLDEDNILTRLLREEGNRTWRIPVAGELDDILGITFVPSLERIYLTTGAAIIELDSANGSQVGRQKLARIANTSPVVLGEFLIYGSRTGQLSWHSYRLGAYVRGYQISQSVQVPPIYADGYVVAVGNDGEIMSLHANSTSQVWTKRALARIVAPPVAGNGIVYVAGLDQHVRAYDLGERRNPRWEYLTESPLRDSPVLIGDRLYQQVPGQGLFCLEAQPLNSPGGKLVWTAAKASGNVLTRIRDTLIAWDGNRRQLSIIDDRLGEVIQTMELPHVDAMMASALVKGDLYATSIDGRIVRLVPR